MALVDFIKISESSSLRRFETWTRFLISWSELWNAIQTYIYTVYICIHTHILT